MFKFNKKNLLNLDHVKSIPLLSSNSKGRKTKTEVEKIKDRMRIKEIKDINGMQITYEVIRKKIKSLFNVNYNKSAKSCNPCMDACKKVDKKINGRELSDVSNNEMKELVKVFSS